MGTKYIEEMLEYGNKIAKRLFNTKHTDLGLISGHACAVAALMSLTLKDDSIMSLTLQNGGYPGYRLGYLPARLNVNVHEIPFDNHKMRIDIETCVDHK